MGNILKEGDVVLGYDTASMNISESRIDTCGFNPQDFQNVYLIKKLFERKNKRRYKLRRLNNNDDMDDQAEQDFMNELDTDPELRSRINL